MNGILAAFWGQASGRSVGSPRRRMSRTPCPSATSGSSLGVGCSFPCHGWCCTNVIFGMLDFSLTEYMVSEDSFTELIFSWGSRTSAPSWRPRRHGLHYAMCLLLGSLMLFQLKLHGMDL